jgi:hypothetical protein
MKTQSKRIFRLAMTIVGAAIIGGWLTYIFTRNTGKDCLLSNKISESIATVGSSGYLDKISALNPLVSTAYASNTQIDVSKLKFIKTADARIEVKYYEESKKEIDSIVQKSNAYISSENETTYGARIQNSVIIRTPSDNFDLLLNTLLATAHKIESKSIEVKDVTEEYIDVEARLKSKRELEERYLALLKQAKNVKDILEIESNLNTIREEIESKQGRLNYLQNQIALSTITLTYFKELPVPLTQKAKFAFRMNKGIIEGWNMFLSVFVGIAYLWVFILIGIAGFLIWKFKKNQKSKV